MTRKFSFAIIVILTAALSAEASFAKTGVFSMYIEKTASPAFLKTYSPGKKLTNVRAADLLSHIYAKSANSSAELMPSYDLLSDTNDVYACRSVNAGLLTPQEGPFKPKAFITRDKYINGLRIALKNNKTFRSYLDRKIKTSSQKNAIISDIGRVSKSNRAFSKRLVQSGLIKLRKGKINPKGAMIESDAVNISLSIGTNLGNTVNRSSYMKKNGYNLAVSKKFTRIVNGYRVPKTSSPSFMKGTDGSLIIFFDGIPETKDGKSIDDINYRIAEVVRTGGVYSNADIITLLEYISDRYSPADSKYNFENRVYIKGGRILSSKPSKPYVCVEEGQFLSICASNKGKVR